MISHRFKRRDISNIRSVVGMMTMAFIAQTFFAATQRDTDSDSRSQVSSSNASSTELNRGIKKEVAKLSEKWNGLLNQADQWQRKLDDTLPVRKRLNEFFSLYPRRRKIFLYSNNCILTRNRMPYVYVRFHMLEEKNRRCYKNFPSRKMAKEVYGCRREH